MTLNMLRNENMTDKNKTKVMFEGERKKGYLWYDPHNQSSPLLLDAIKLIYSFEGGSTINIIVR